MCNYPFIMYCTRFNTIDNDKEGRIWYNNKLIHYMIQEGLYIPEKGLVVLNKTYLEITKYYI
jgi:hypothetical protein